MQYDTSIITEGLKHYMNKIHFLNTRFVAGCLVVSMVCGMLPVTVYADDIKRGIFHRLLDSVLRVAAPLL